MITILQNKKITNFPFYFFIIITFVIIISKRLPSKSIHSDNKLNIEVQNNCKQICEHLYNCLSGENKNVELASKAKGFYSGCYDGCGKHIQKLDSCVYDTKQSCKDYGACFENSLKKVFR